MVPARPANETSPGVENSIGRCVFLAGILGVAVTLAVDMTSSRLFRSDIYAKQVASDGDVLTVIHPGIFSDVALQATPLLPVTREHGPTLMVGTKPVGSYSATEHVERTVGTVSDILRANRSLAKIAGLGISMGGGTLLDSLGELRRTGAFSRYEIEAVNLTLEDSPTSLRDTSFAAFGPASRYPAGIIINGLQDILGVAGINTVNEDPLKEPFGVGADMELWLKTQKAGNKIPWSLVVDQVQSLAARTSPTPGDMEGVGSVVFMGSTEDKIVDHSSAIPAWRTAAEGIPFEVIDVEGALHCSIVSNPLPYRQSLRKAYEFHKLVSSVAK